MDRVSLDATQLFVAKFWIFIMLLLIVILHYLLVSFYNVCNTGNGWSQTLTNYIYKLFHNLKHSSFSE